MTSHHQSQASILQQRGRRLVLGAAACFALATAGLAQAQTVELKVSHYLPPNHTLNVELIRWSADLEQKSNGRLKISIFSSSQMGPITRQYDLARTGVADIAWVLHGATPGRFPLTELSQLPYAFNPESGGVMKPPLSASAASGLLTAMAPQMAKEYEGTKLLYAIAQPNIGLFFNKTVVRTPADMKGMRIRHNGPLPSKMIEAWGATPAAVAPVELADALEKGTVNGMTFNYEASQAFQLGAVIKTVTEINAYAASFALVMNEKKYESLPADLRKLIDDSTGEAGARRVGAKFDEAEAAGRKYVLENKVQIVTPTAAQAESFRTPLKPLIEQVIEATQAKGLPARKVYDDLRARVNAAK